MSTRRNLVSELNKYKTKHIIMKIDSLHTCDDDFDKNILQVIIGIMANMPQEIVNIICTYIFKCEYFYDNCPLINYECFLKDELTNLFIYLKKCNLILFSILVIISTAIEFNI